jgi:predicted nucleotidyltransferase
MSFNGKELVGELLNRRRLEAAERIEHLRKRLVDAEKLCGGIACVYMTGSFGRGESSAHSDLDLFIVGQCKRDLPELSLLDQILVKADLIQASRELGFREFSRDGQFLVGYSVVDLVDTLGTPKDDVENTFTARLLLLLESSVLIGRAAYHQITNEVIAAYWKDYVGHRNDFMSAFLANDILRMWRTFCVNYEAHTKSEPEREMAKRRIKNYKLKHSRLLTCYSALLYLLAVFSKNKTVSPTDAEHMISLSPTGRLEWLLTQGEVEVAHASLNVLLNKYEEFLSNTDAPEDDLILRFMDKQNRRKYWESSNEFGDLVFTVLGMIGNNRPFHRVLVV